MPESKRQCSTCLYFRNANLPGNGWCVHPKRQVASDVKVLVRNAELACRNTWDDDLWQDASLPATTSQETSRTARGIAFLNSRLDDEVTSVVDAGDRHADPAKSAPSDDVITATTVRDDRSGSRQQNFSANDTNSAAVADQEERARIMARGNREAILGARKRHVQRRKESLKQSEDPPVADAPAEDDAVVSTRSVDTQASPAGTDPSQTSDHGAGAGDARATSRGDRTPPRVTPSVDLPKLRNFLHGKEDPTAEASRSQPSQTTQFEHVLNQAEKIKQRSDRNRARPVTSSSGDDRENDDSRPDTLPQSKKKAATSDIVWDVPPSEFSTTLARARAAIYSPSGKEIATLEQSDELVNGVASSQSGAAAEAQPSNGMESSHPHRAVQENDVAQHAMSDSNDAAVTSQSRTGDVVREPARVEDTPLAENEWEHDGVELQAEPVAAAESPRTSWWRSFNFGFGRRNQPQPEPMYEEFSDDEWDTSDPGPYEDFATGEVSPSGDDAFAPYDQGAEEAIGWRHADTAQDHSTGRAAPRPADRQEEEPRATRFVSSEENWELDLREFPDPRPPEWHSNRNALLSQQEASSPDELQAGDSDRQVNRWDTEAGTSAQDDELTWVYPEPPVASPPAPEPAPRREFMDLAHPEGMDAFRNAIFGTGPATQPEATGALRAEPPHRAEPITQPPPLPAARQSAPQPDRPQSAVEAPSSPPPGRQEAPQRPDRRRTHHRSSRQAHQSRKAFPDLAEPEAYESASPPVSKVCLTCRSYQPSDEPDRGRCANSHAGTFRQMVDAQGLSCRSSFGDWWIRNDATWLPPESRIAPETPRTNALAARSQPADEVESRQPREKLPVRTRKTG